MTELIKTSPVIGAQKKMNPIIGVHQGMEVALSFVDQKIGLGVTKVILYV